MPRRGRRRGGKGSALAWVWLVPLVVIGVGVVATRSLGRPAAIAPTPTVLATATRAAASTATGAALAATARPAAAARSTPAPTPTVPRPRAAPIATRAATRAPTREATSVPTLASTRAPTAAASGAVALTFDAGADRGNAEDILDVLADEHAVASFGITGRWAKANPDLVRRMAADGHLVFNHTLDHRSFTGLSDALGGLSAAARRAELDDADAIIAPLIGHSTRPFYRLPYGDDDAHVVADVGQDGYTRKIGWTVDSLGWRGLQATDILARCLKLAAPGAIYAMHVGRASQDGIALPRLIDGLRQKGYSFTRVDAL